MSLHDDIKKLAADKPELRVHLLPLLRKVGYSDNLSDNLFAISRAFGAIDPSLRALAGWFDKYAEDEDRKVIRDAVTKTMKAVRDAHSRYFFNNPAVKEVVARKKKELGLR